MGLRLATVVATGAAVSAASGESNATTKRYVAPDVAGLHWAETFDGDVWSRWKASTAEKYSGKFTVQTRQNEALLGDVGLVVPEEAKHYGASVAFPALVGTQEKSFVMQYEVKFQDGLSCGGSYVKLFDSSVAEEFKDDTPYVIMFGPDRCGSTDKVHFILRHKNPKTGEWEEKHFKDAPHVPSDNLSHLYTLIVNPDNTFSINIDGEKSASGDLMTSMNPPINPPKEIDDPVDKKPAAWVDEAKIDDPESSKPDDWDEDEPRMIPDPKVSKPAGWVDDGAKRIADPAAQKPSDWDDEEDGEWEAPQIDNPACSVGCGKWEAPKIENPKYKGKWYAPKIDNPEYIGVWKPRQIANPSYFLDETPGLLPRIDSVGIDIWTMSKGLIFDNILVATDAARAKAFADATFKQRKELELLQQPKPNESAFWKDPLGFLEQNMLAVGVTLAAVLVATLWCCCRSSAPRPSGAEARREARRRKKDEREAAKETEGTEAAGSASQQQDGEEKEEGESGKDEGKVEGEGEGDEGEKDKGEADEGDDDEHKED